MVAKPINRLKHYSTRRSTLRGAFRFGLQAAVMLSLGGCALFEQRPPEDIVEERANLHLAALRSADWDRALTFTTPEFQKSSQARRYRAFYSAAPTWLDAEVYAVECEELTPVERCEVKTRVYPFVPPHIQANISHLPVSVSHTWVLLNGQWYRYEEK